LQGEADPVFGATPCVDVVKVVIGKRVMSKERKFIDREIKKGRTLALGQDAAVRHVSFAFYFGFAYL
jgi:hypothetical protein